MSPTDSAIHASHRTLTATQGPLSPVSESAAGGLRFAQLASRPLTTTASESAPSAMPDGPRAMPIAPSAMPDGPTRSPDRLRAVTPATTSIATPRTAAAAIATTLAAALVGDPSALADALARGWPAAAGRTGGLETDLLSTSVDLAAPPAAGDEYRALKPSASTDESAANVTYIAPESAVTSGGTLVPLKAPSSGALLPIPSWT